MGPEVVFREFASILDQEQDLSFASTMVQVLLGAVNSVLLPLMCIVIYAGGCTHQVEELWSVLAAAQFDVVWLSGENMNPGSGKCSTAGPAKAARSVLYY
jgi:hypothetical protein